MDEQSGQEHEDASELTTPSVRARQIAAGVGRLADLARDPRTVNALASFAEVLDTVRADADELASVLAESEEAGEAVGEDNPEARAAEPSRAAPLLGQAAPLTFKSLHYAVTFVARDVQTRTWLKEEAELYGTMAEAVAIVQAAVAALRAFFEEQAKATEQRGHVAVDERGQPAREPAELQFVYTAVEGARALAEAFEDMRARGGRRAPGPFD